MLGGFDEEQILGEIRRAAARGRQQADVAGRPSEPARQDKGLPDPREPRFRIERDVLKLAMQAPATMAGSWSDLETDDFTHPLYRGIFDEIAQLGGPSTATPGALLTTLPDSRADAQSLVSALAVEPLHLAADPDERVASAYVVRLRELTAARRIEQVKSRLQRTNPLTEVTSYNRMFGELVALESHRRALREQAAGGGIG
jgi:DNA primase